MRKFLGASLMVMMFLTSIPQAILAQSAPDEMASDPNIANSHIRFERARYDPDSGDCIRLAANDPDETKATGAFRDVIVASIQPGTASRDREKVRLLQDGASSALYENPDCLPLAYGDAALEDGTLQVHPGDLIIAIYQDPDNPGIPDHPEKLGPGLTKFAAGFDVSADFAVIAGGQAKGDFSFEIDSSLEISQANIPLDIVIGPNEYPIIFGEGRIVFEPLDDRDLDAFVQQYSASVVDEFETPRGSNSEDDDATDTQRIAVLHVNTEQVAVDDLAYLAEMLGAYGHYRFSSGSAARLFALMIAEQIGGRLMHHDPVLWRLNAIASEERLVGTTSSTFENGMSENWFNVPEVSVDEAVTFLDLIDRNQAQSVNVAFIDGGFARPSDFPAGDPLSGMINPDYGLSAVAGGPNPAFQCAGGASGACTWHGTSTFSIAAAVTNNQFGIAGVAGHARLADGRDGVQGLINPTLLTAFSPFFSSLVRQINTAVDGGVDAINLSAGFACEPFLGIDFCAWETRAAVNLYCSAPVLGTVLLGPIGLLIDSIGTIGGCVALNVFFHEAGYDHIDALRTAAARAEAAGIPIIASGPENVAFLGNEYGPFDALDITFLPCVIRSVICVGAMEEDASGSMAATAINPFGSGIDIWAPGAGLLATPNPATSGAAQSFDGTSASPPYVTGIVAMMLAANPALTNAEIRMHLQATSNLLDVTPTGTCTPHPAFPGLCVGFVDASASVRRASGVSLTCAPTDSNANRSTASAVNFGTILIPPAGGTASVSTGSDQLIHALDYDADYYRFNVPVLPGALAGDKVWTRLSVSSPEPEFGDGLVVELLEDSTFGAGIGTLTRLGPADTVIEGNLRNDRDYYMRVMAADRAYERDNCYEATVTVLNMPDADRYETNESLGGSAPAVEGWNHDHLICPDSRGTSSTDCSNIFDDGFAESRAREIWSMTIADLSLDGAIDRDFLRVQLPNPSAHDGDIVECGFTTRRNEFGDVVDIAMTSSLNIDVVRTPNAVSARPVDVGGEQLVAYRTNGDVVGSDTTPSTGAGAALSLVIGCPQTDEGLRDVIISFGELMGGRRGFATGGYELRLTHVVEIYRDVTTMRFEPGARELGDLDMLPCLTLGPGSFPYCLPDLDGLARIELERPEYANGTGICQDQAPCPDIYIFDIREGFEGLKLRLHLTNGLHLRVVDRRFKTVAEPVLHAKGDESDGGMIDASLTLPALDEGFYFLILDGEPGTVELTYVPPAASARLQ